MSNCHSVGTMDMMMRMHGSMCMLCRARANRLTAPAA